MNLTEFFLRCTQFGAEWVMWLLVGLSFLNVAVIIERLTYLFSRRIRFAKFQTSITSAIKDGRLNDAVTLAKSSKAPEAVVAAAGLAWIQKGHERMSEAMLAARASEKIKLEANVSFLATIGSNAPFIGLFGTVLGIIRASHDLSQAQKAEEEVSSAVMSGVFEALVATAVGLFVAIPAVIAYNWIVRKIRVRLGRVDAIAHSLLALHSIQVPPREKPPVQKEALSREVH